MAFATASSPANREPGDNAQTATPPQAQAQPRQSPGKAEPPYVRQNPQHAPEPASAHQAPAHAGTPDACQSPPAHAGAPSMRQSPPARTRPQRMPEPPTRTRPQRMPEPPTRARTPARQSPQRAPGRKPGSGALTEPSIGLRDVNRAEQRVPRAVAEPSSEFPLRRIVNFVQLRSKLTILRSLKAKTHDYLRYREAHTRTTDNNVHFPLPIPRKTVCFDRQRPKPTVFRIAHPTRQPNPMPNKQHSRHRSR